MKKPILMDFPMPITTPHLLIRPPKLGDGLALNPAVLETYDELKRIMPWAQTKPTLEDSEEFARLSAANWILKINEEPYLPLFIFDINDYTFMGAVTYHHMDWKVPAMELGYWLRKSKQNQGMMTEAVHALTQYAFFELKVKRLEIRCDVLNDRSKKIPERLGYHLESQLKWARINTETNQLSDTVVYVRHDLENLPNLPVQWPLIKRT